MSSDGCKFRFHVFLPNSRGVINAGFPNANDGTKTQERNRLFRDLTLKHRPIFSVPVWGSNNDSDRETHYDMRVRVFFETVSTHNQCCLVTFGLSDLNCMHYSLIPKKEGVN